MENSHQRTTPYYNVQYDLDSCDKEPIHLIRIIQSHASLLGVRLDTLEIIHASKNTGELLLADYQELLGQTLGQVLHNEAMDLLRLGLSQEEISNINPIRIDEFRGKLLPNKLNLIVHIQDQTLILEFEPYREQISADQFLQMSDRAVQAIQSARNPQELFDITVRKIKDLTAYDRVMLYRFDDDQHGVVEAEAKEDYLESFHQLHYPASDIPRQARALFVRNQIRIIADVQSTPVFIHPSMHPDTGKPLDLTDSVARGVSPIHIEYLKNMGVGASLSVAIVIEGKLWGLISSHHYSPKFIDFRLRNLIRFLGKVVSGHLALQEAHDYRHQVLQSNLTRSRLTEQMSENWNILNGLLHQSTTLMDLNGAGGAALKLDGELHTIGQVPPRDNIQELIDWLNEKEEVSIFATEHLAAHWDPALSITDTAAGLLAVRIAQTPPEYILWFKPETIKIVNWGGDPNKAITRKAGQSRLSPRHSFDKWREEVRHKSVPWHQHDLDVAVALRNDIRDVIIRKYKEIRRLNDDLKEAYNQLETFSYSVSHDLRAPLRTIEGFSQILQEDYSDKLGEQGKQVLNTIASSVGKMNSFINDLLSLSKLGRKAMIINELDLAREATSVWNYILQNADQPAELVIVEPLPPVYADQTFFQQLLSNLFSNAVKYARRGEPARVEIGGQRLADRTSFYIKDNGIGFDMRHADRIFDPFQRLVPESEYEGTGVGLAIVRKVINVHDADIRVESQPGVGTTFFCTFPRINLSSTEKT